MPINAGNERTNKMGTDAMHNVNAETMCYYVIAFRRLPSVLTYRSCCLFYKVEAVKLKSTMAQKSRAVRSSAIRQLKWATLSVGLVLVPLSWAYSFQAAVGTWSGKVQQPGVGTYPIVIVLDNAGGGTTIYPTLKCKGILSGGPKTYSETISTNRMSPTNPEGCIDGEIDIEISSDEMAWRWSGRCDGDFCTASAILRRKQ